MFTASASLVEQLLASYPGFAFCKDTSFTIVAANDNVAIAAGYKIGTDIVGKTDHELPWARFADIYQKDDRRVLSSHSVKTMEPFLINSQVATTYCRKMPLVDEKNQIIGLIGYSEVINPLEFRGDFANVVHAQRQYTLISKADLHRYFFGLTLREAECLFYLVRGFTMEQIAEVLQISNRTVESYLNNAKKKFSCKNKSGLIGQCFVTGFVYFMPESLEGKESILTQDEAV